MAAPEHVHEEALTPEQEQLFAETAIDAEDMATTLRVIGMLHELPAGHPDIETVKRAAGTMCKRVRKARRAEARAAELGPLREQDAKVLASTATGSPLRIDDETKGIPLTSNVIGEVAGELNTPRGCYICHAKYTTVDAFYHWLCPSCAAMSHAKRHQRVDLRPRDLGVRVEDQGQLGGDRGQAGVHVRPEPAVGLAAHHGQTRIVRLGVRGGRGVVRDHDGGQRVSGIAQQAVDEGEGGGRIAVVRDHHGHRRRGRLGCHAGSSLSSDGRRTQRPRTCVEYREALAKTRASRWGGAMAARTALSTLTGQPRDGKGEPCPAPRGRTKP